MNCAVRAPPQASPHSSALWHGCSRLLSITSRCCWYERRRSPDSRRPGSSVCAGRAALLEKPRQMLWGLLRLPQLRDLWEKEIKPRICINRTAAGNRRMVFPMREPWNWHKPVLPSAGKTVEKPSNGRYEGHFGRKKAPVSNDWCFFHCSAFFSRSSCPHAASRTDGVWLCAARR